jgi:deoxyribodipyrimidine photo-lyase
MLESLEDLDKELKDKYKSQLHYFYGSNTKVLEDLLKEYSYNSIYFNMDYSPYAIKRDNEIKSFCEKHKIKCNIIEDYLLSPIGTFLKEDGGCYQKYTPFKNNAKKNKVNIPNNFVFDKIGKFDKIKNSYDLSNLDKYYKVNNKILVHGGRENGLKILKTMKNFVNYGSERNDLITPTTHLSAYIKFGCISIREVYHTILKLFGINHGLIDQLYWREFYFYLAYYFPRVLQGKSLKEDYDKIKWENNHKIFDAWTKGKTGFPAVDAGMREMNETGYMHNRARLITSSFLIKVLLIDWQDGEKYFAQHLTDYDPASNNGNWQWGASTGADSQPYFRIFNPWLQSEEYDPDAEYIKQWVPELREIDAKVIHQWYKYSSEKEFKGIKYPAPIVDYSKQKEIALKMYSSVFK